MIANPNNHVDEQWPWVLLGDLNAFYDESPIQEIRKTWHADNFYYAIDWLLYRPANRFNFIESYMIADTDELVSDHEAVVSKIELRGI